MFNRILIANMNLAVGRLWPTQINIRAPRRHYYDAVATLA
jgi:hypothetical protein